MHCTQGCTQDFIVRREGARMDTPLTQLGGMGGTVCSHLGGLRQSHSPFATFATRNMLASDTIVNMVPWYTS